MNEYALYVKVNDYAHEVWFEVIDLYPSDGVVTIFNHILDYFADFTIDEKMEFKVVEVAE